MTSTLKIAIIGAGPAGCTLARLLQQNGLDCTIYEAEAHQHARNQGGSLDLHANGGQLALAEAGLLEEFKKLSRPEGECMKISDAAGNILFDENESGVRRPAEFAGRPEIDRTILRDMLVESLRPATIVWGCKVDRIERDANRIGQHIIHFADGTQESGVDLVVGADGAFSRVRPLITAEQPEYAGVTLVELWKNNVDEANPWLSRLIGQGSLFMFDNGRCIIAQRQQNASVRVYACLKTPLAWKDECGINWKDSRGGRETVANSYFGDCGHDLRRAILECDDHMVVRHLWMLPVGHTWETQNGVTLMGDAAHVMTPFAGVGVNVAMTDALDLARNLVKRKILAQDGQVDVKAAIESYEKAMFVRAEENARKSARGLEHHFRADAAQEWAEKLNGKVEGWRQQRRQQQHDESAV